MELISFRINNFVVFEWNMIWYRFEYLDRVDFLFKWLKSSAMCLAPWNEVNDTKSYRIRAAKHFIVLHFMLNCFSLPSQFSCSIQNRKPNWFRIRYWWFKVIFYLWWFNKSTQKTLSALKLSVLLITSSLCTVGDN